MFSAYSLISLLTSTRVNDYHYIFSDYDLGEFSLAKTLKNKENKTRNGIILLPNHTNILVFANGDIDLRKDDLSKFVALSEIDYLSPDMNPAFSQLMAHLGTKHGNFYAENPLQLSDIILDVDGEGKKRRKTNRNGRRKTNRNGRRKTFKKMR